MGVLLLLRVLWVFESFFFFFFFGGGGGGGAGVCFRFYLCECSGSLVQAKLISVFP